MNVFMVGGTGLLGSLAAQEFINRGHNVKTLALAGVPNGAKLPEQMQIVFGNHIEMTDDELTQMMSGCECFVFAAGVDERVEFPDPIYDCYVKYNIEPVERFLRIAKACGVKKSVILGSYFTYLDRTRPDMQLCKHHPYIRSRVEQQKVAFSFADETMDVGVLELPYIFGTQAGRKPVWTIFVEKLEKMGPVSCFPTGGTAMLTARQVGEAIVGVAEKNVGANYYPVATENYTWGQMLTQVHIGMGKPKRKYIPVPKASFKLYGRFLKMMSHKKGLGEGLDMVMLADIMYNETFIDSKGTYDLGVTADDIDSAIIESIKVSVDAGKNKTGYIEMKAE